MRLTAKVGCQISETRRTQETNPEAIIYEEISPYELETFKPPPSPHKSPQVPFMCMELIGGSNLETPLPRGNSAPWAAVPHRHGRPGHGATGSDVTARARSGPAPSFTSPALAADPHHSMARAMSQFGRLNPMRWSYICELEKEKERTVVIITGNKAVITISTSLRYPCYRS